MICKFGGGEPFLMFLIEIITQASYVVDYGWPWPHLLADHNTTFPPMLSGPSRTPPAASPRSRLCSRICLGSGVCLRTRPCCCLGTTLCSRLGLGPLAATRKMKSLIGQPPPDLQPLDLNTETGYHSLFLNVKKLYLPRVPADACPNHYVKLNGHVHLTVIII
jgi:hypothetical protein